MNLTVCHYGNLFNTGFKPLHLEDSHEQNSSTRPRTNRKTTQEAKRGNRAKEGRNSQTSSRRISRGVTKMSKYRDIIQDELEQLEDQENQEQQAEAAKQAAQA